MLNLTKKNKKSVSDRTVLTKVDLCECERLLTSFQNSANLTNQKSNESNESGLTQHEYHTLTMYKSQDQLQQTQILSFTLSNP